MAETMKESEAKELVEEINKLIGDKYEAIVSTNWAGGYFVGVGLKSPRPCPSESEG